MEGTIGLQELLLIIKKRLILVAILAFVSTTITSIFTHFFITPIYQVSTQLVVSRSDIDNAITSAEISGINQLMNTFNQIMVSPRILDRVIKELNLNESSVSLRRRLEASTARDSQVIILTVQHEHPVLAYDIANKTAEVFARDIPDIMNFDNVNILAPALIPSSPVSPRLVRNAGMGFLIGTMSGILLTLLIEFLDKTIKTEQDVEKLINLPVLGMIPIMTPEDFEDRKMIIDLGDEDVEKQKKETSFA